MLDGQVDIIAREKIEGWLLDRDDLTRKATVAIVVDGREIGRCRADLPRGNKTAPATDAASTGGFLFEFKPPLTIFGSHAIEVRNADTGALLRHGQKTLRAPRNGKMPLAPILITSRGRSGTTLLMKEFVSHPDIVVADIYPYEIKLIDYYTSAYKVLASHKYPGDGKEMDYVETTRRFMQISGNPFNNPGKQRLGAGESLAEIFDQDFPAHLNFIFRETIAKYYRALATTYRKTQARFFAEKSDIDQDTRVGTRMLLGDLKEIVMIRDPRDFMCSAKAFWKMNTREALDTVAYTTRRMEEIHAENDADTMFVRYEDLIRDPVATRRGLAEFIGLDALAPIGDDQALLGIHATSQSPERSVGRWQDDLDKDEIAACDARFASFMERFGYAGAGTFQPRPDAAKPVLVKAPPPPVSVPAQVAAAIVTPPVNPAAMAPQLTVRELSSFPTPDAAGRFPTPEDQPAFRMLFGRDGDAARYQDAGWSSAEQGYTWTAALESYLRLPRPERPGTYLLRLRLRPFLAADRLTAQRVAVSLNGQLLGETRVIGPSVIDCRVGWDVLSRAEPMRLRIATPDAARPTEVAGHPNDSRLLGLSFQRLWLFGPLADSGAPTGDPPPSQKPVTEPNVEPPLREPPPAAETPREVPPAEPPRAGLAPAKLMLKFESLGENCEFGLAQRRSGVEPIGLFRFASTPLPLLMNALAARFEGMGEAENLKIEVSPNGREYMVFEKRFQFRYHAWVQVGEKTPDEVLARETKRLPFLVRKLVADLSEGAKIFVYHGMSPITQAQATALLRAIRAFGPSTLLWVELADADNKPGSVRRLGDGLLKGHMDRFAPGEDAHDISLQCWTDVCANALDVMAQPPMLEMARA